jgi:predicted Rossmann fold nucleotide-binding protein DprA/Smf involved in DNA uptake
VTDDVLAVVGSTSFARGGEAIRVAEAIIAAVIVEIDPVRVVSGGAAGVDTWAERIAAHLGYNQENGLFVVHLPRHHRWAPDGFQARNILIATGPTTHLLAIRCHASKTYGSGWTADYAEKHGRIVYRVTL